MRRDGGTSNMPRICLLTETFYPVVGGGETHARLLSAELNTLGMPTIVLTRRSFPDLPAIDMVGMTPTHRVSPTRMKRWGKYAMMPYVLHALARLKDEYDLVYVCGFRVLGAPGILAARVLGKKCVLRAEALGEMSGKYAFAMHSRSDGIFSRIVSSTWSGAVIARNSILRRADAFVGISDPVAEEFLQCRVPPAKIHPIPNGIDPDRFCPMALRDKRNLRHKLGLPKGILAAYSGKLNRGKGLEHLVRAWDAVIRNRHGAHLVLIGSGGNQSLSCEENLRLSVKKLGLESSITFTGYVENVEEYLQACDLFVIPTEYEAFGLALVEAMSCGLPSIASEVGGIPGIVDHLRNGVLVAPGDSEALAWAIIALIEQPELRRRLGHEARKTVRSRFSIRAVAEQHMELFHSLCA